MRYLLKPFETQFGTIRFKIGILSYLRLFAIYFAVIYFSYASKFDAIALNSLGAAGWIFWLSTCMSIRSKILTQPCGTSLLRTADFIFSKRKFNAVFLPIVVDMREEYFEALSQNRIWKARWVRVRGTWSFFAAMGLDRAFAFVSFFVKAWKSVN